MNFITTQGRWSGGLLSAGAYRACSECWREDGIPFIRRAWRQKFVTICQRHRGILATACLSCGKRFSSSFSIHLSLAKCFHSPLSVCRACGADVRDQDQPQLFEGVDLDPYLVVEEIYQRSFERGWFSLADGERLLIGPTPHMCPWDWHRVVPVYPEIPEDFAVWNSQEVRAAYFRKAFNRWILSSFSHCS
jgi:hypothetical protein